MSRERTIRRLITQIEAIRANQGMIDDPNEERLLGAAEALKLALGAKSYVEAWIVQSEDRILAHHNQTRKGCDCGVCKRKPEAA